MPAQQIVQKAPQAAESMLADPVECLEVQQPVSILFRIIFYSRKVLGYHVLILVCQVCEPQMTAEPMRLRGGESTSCNCCGDSCSESCACC